MALPVDVRNVFHNVASKSDEYRNGFEWFANEIPSSIADNVDAIRVILDGGTATTTTYIDDPWATTGGHVETTTVEFPDRDFSRHVSGANGGEYTPDNVTLESASINRSRGAENMTPDEIETAQTALETDASILADADIITPVGDVTATVETVETGSSMLGEIGETVMDGLLPATVGLMMGKHVADQFDEPIDKIGYGTAAMGGTVLLAMTPPGQLALTGYAIWNVAKLAKRGIDWCANNA